MRNLITIILSLSVGALSTFSVIKFTNSQPLNSWKLVYSHDENGLLKNGSKQELIDAIRSGKSVRVFWQGKKVEHLTDAFFLTILGGEVFAQIEKIQGQKPILTPPTIELRENEWLTILSTNGDRALKWFIQ